ncbi:MAG: hypothetical protein QGG36_16270 [Pirellulaceae bacterium]|jgi:rhodanese-related sulfurtransferase|nr:hypothetical protein [Pirellulaceae bacterium]MDP7017361.1 hypothetical protein [Pirellulaceae bacterium]
MARSNTSLLIIVLAGSAMLAIAIFATGVYVAFLPRNLTTSAADRAFVVTASDLQQLIPEIVVRTDAEVMEKTESPGSVVTLTYRYSHPGQEQLEIITRLHALPEEIDAGAQYVDAVAQAAADVESIVGGARLEDRGDTFEYGERSTYGAIKVLADYAGIYFVCRRGNRVYSFVLVNKELTQYDLVCDEISDKLAVVFDESLDSP